MGVDHCRETGFCPPTREPTADLQLRLRNGAEAGGQPRSGSAGPGFTGWEDSMPAAGTASWPGCVRAAPSPSWGSASPRFRRE